MIPYMHIEYEWLWLSGPFKKKKKKGKWAEAQLEIYSPSLLDSSQNN